MECSRTYAQPTERPGRISVTTCRRHCRENSPSRRVVLASQHKVGRNAWIATGGARIARVLATRDGGNTWNAYNTRLESSPSGGAFTVDFRNPFDGIVGGGDLDPANTNSADTAMSNDGGQTWTLTNPPPVRGAIFGLSYVGQTGGGGGNNLGRAVVVTANDGGAAWTPDEGNTWFTLPGVTGYWAVAFASPKAGWLVGTDGRILKVSF